MTQFEMNEQFDYHKHQSVYISDYIKVADNKAGLTLGVAGVYFAFMINQLKELATQLWMKEITFSVYDIWQLYIFFISLCVFFVGMVYLSLVIWPRYKADTSLYHSWGGIAAFGSPHDYVRHIKSSFQTKELFLEKMAQQNYSLAKVCLTKFTRLRTSYGWLGIGAICTTLTWLFVHT